MKTTTNIAIAGRFTTPTNWMAFASAAASPWTPMTALERMYMAYVRCVKKQGYRTIWECPVSWTEWMTKRAKL